MSNGLRIILAAAAAAALAGGAASASEDELAKGEWEGRRTFQASASAGGGGGGGTPTTSEGPPPADGGTATPPDTGEEEDGRAVPTEEDGPEGTAGGDGEGEAAEGTAPDDPEPSTESDVDEEGPGPLGPRECDPATGSCTGTWQMREEQPLPKFTNEHTDLTVVLFRTDAYGFLCNGYARAISTWYYDWIATSSASHDEETRYEVTVELAGGCAGCVSSMTVTGMSSLEARAQLRTSWGTLSSSSSAQASAHSSWAGPVDCGDTCSASVVDRKGSSSWGVDLGPVKASNTEGTSFASAVGMGGRGQQVVLPAKTVTQLIRNRGSAAVHAAGSEDNVQAKCRVGQDLRIRGETGCGAVCEYSLEQISK